MNGTFDFLIASDVGQRLQSSFDHGLWAVRRSMGNDRPARARAVSTVVGIILLTALTVILGVVVGTFVLGWGEDIGDGPPMGEFSVTVDDEADRITINHLGGEPFDSRTIRVRVSNGTAEHTFEPTASSSTLAPGESAVIALDRVGGDNRLDWDPSQAGWEYRSTATFDGISRENRLELRVIHTPSNNVLLDLDLPPSTDTSTPTPTPTATPTATPTPTATEGDEED